MNARSMMMSGLMAVVALTMGACAKELASEPTAMAAAPGPKSGKDIYAHWCADCHDPGPGHPGTLRMEGDFGAESSVLLRFPNLDAETVKFAVRNGFQMMPPFRVTEISDEELDRLAQFVVKK